MKNFLVPILALFLFTGATEQQVLSFVVNSGGLNTRAGDLTVKDNEATDLQNVNFSTTGSIVKRKGNTKFGSATNVGNANDITLIADYQLLDGNQKVVVAAGTEVRKTDGTGDGSVWDDITSGETVTADKVFDWSQFRNILVFTNGTDLVLAWDQATSASDIKQLTIPTNLTAAFHTEVFNAFHFLGNVVVNSVTHSSRLYFSNIGTVETWTDTDFVDIGRDKAEGVITMMEALGDRLVIGKEFGAIYNVFFTGDDDVPFITQKSFSQVGCGANRSAVIVKNVLFFWSTDGIGFYAYDGVNSVEISERIQPTLEGFTASRYADVIGEAHPTLGQIWWSMTSTGTTHDRIVVYDYINNAWSIHVGIAANYIQLLEKSSELVLYTGDYGGRILEQNTSDGDVNSSGTDATPINAFYQTKWYDLANPALVKSLDHIILYSKVEGAWDLNVAWAFDFSDSNFGNLDFSLDGGGVTWGDENWGDFNWSTSGGGLLGRLDTNGRGRVMSITFTNKNANEPFEITGFSLIVKGESIF